MKIALIGYGKMGKAIERFAKERGHRIVSIVDVDNPNAIESSAFASADVAIEFTVPSQAVDNIRKSWAANVPVVSGTTGWWDRLPELKEELKTNGQTLFWSSNFSLGVNMVFELNRKLAQMMNAFQSYDVSISEIHHTEKKDAPSGTAITLGEDIIQLVDRKSSWVAGAQPREVSEIPIKSIREGRVPGIHTIKYEGPVDIITITHEAKSREGFAVGAVVAAEYAVKHKGFLTMQEMMQF